MKRLSYLLMSLIALASCSSEAEFDDIAEVDANDFYLVVDLPSNDSRVSYGYTDFYYDYSDGNIAARWELGDIIKVYEKETGGYTHVYPDYEAYDTVFPFPMAPVNDLYYRFECVGGVGTAHGIFKYVGLAHTTVVAGAGGSWNVNIDIIYNHKIKDWEKFDGLVIYGNPLRYYMMRHQSVNHDMTHLKYGQRMKGNLCSHHFDNWYNHNDSTPTVAGASSLILYNTSGCIYRVILGGLEDVIYGGAEVTLEMPGITSGHPEGDLRNYPMHLSLGDYREHQEILDPWCEANPGRTAPHTPANTITAYIVGWPGTLSAGNEAVVKLKDNFYGKTYTWKLSKSTDVTFKECKYYTFDLTDNEYTVTNN